MTKTATLVLLLVLSCPVETVAQYRPRFGDRDFVRVELRAKVQADLRGFDPHITTEEGAFDMQRVRFGIEGRFLRFFQYEAEYETREHFGGRKLKNALRDAFINFDYFDDFQLKAGKFKVPFSQEQNTGASNLDFILRSRIAENLAPARDVGAMLHGRFFNRGLGYEVGVFRNDGENARPKDNAPKGDTTVAVRITGMPLRLFSAPRALRDFEVAGAVTSNDTPEGLTSLRGRAYSDETFFPHIHAQGRRLRAGADLNWTHGPYSVKGEYSQVRQAREGQSVRATDLPDAVASGWYIAATWVVTGEAKEGGVNPRRAFLDGGTGAFELAARHDTLRFNSAGSLSSIPSRSPRAPNIFESADRAWTMGLNWYPNSYMKIQINGIRESFTDLQRAPIEGRRNFWLGMVRFQFVM
ncbi:MAG: hypothetical protein HY646_22365 [Acidobacteria bacterium]|nr:hypothetical protein [Acidobacteriota bacterium]